ncbi:MAG: bacillithiol biosynthesis cysteine-adding enzyme BshC [Spirosomaceae bacterium]|nr:bacillithiol biosynthesis cysteine-adding enzyme BshC [Spirosomataceae bacterium]
MKLDLSSTKAFPKLFLDYIGKNQELTSFYKEYPKIEGFKNIIDAKPFSEAKRKILVESLKNQYKNIENQPDFSVLLEPNTYTVTTGHQLNIFTGPLYIIYKIVTIINLAKQLKEAYPAYNFVPIYWMATEDHDFAEIARRPRLCRNRIF